ncbi:MAG: flagellar protein FlaG [Fervidobacterium sp.]
MSSVKGVGNLLKTFQSDATLNTPTRGVGDNLQKADQETYQATKIENQQGKRAEELEIFKENFEKLKKLFRGEAEFKIDKDANMIIIKIKDPDTGEVIRQIPPELAVKLAKNIQELLGVLMDERV